MLNPFGVEKFAEEYRREAEAFVARQRLVAQAERSRGQTPMRAGIIARLVRAMRLLTARPASLGALRKV